METTWPVTDFIFLPPFQVVLWIQQNFLLPSEITAKNGELDLTFLSARTQLPLQITMSSGGVVSAFVHKCGNLHRKLQGSSNVLLVNAKECTTRLL